MLKRSFWKMRAVPKEGDDRKQRSPCGVIDLVTAAKVGSHHTGLYSGGSIMS